MENRAPRRLPRALGSLWCDKGLTQYACATQVLSENTKASCNFPSTPLIGDTPNVYTAANVLWSGWPELPKTRKSPMDSIRNSQAGVAPSWLFEIHSHHCPCLEITPVTCAEWSTTTASQALGTNLLLPLHPDLLIQLWTQPTSLPMPLHLYLSVT